MPPVFVLAGGLHCATPPPSDMSVYTKALAEDSLDTDARIALCEQIGAADLLAECVAGVLNQAALSPEDRCPRIPAGRWQDECWFKVAEDRGPGLSPAAAADACRRAGSYMGPCVGHVLSQHVLALHRTQPAAAQVESLAIAWEEALKRPSARTDTWRFYWELEFRATADPARCRPLRQPQPCYEALASKYRARLRQMVRADPTRWCQTDPRPTVVASWDSPPDAKLTKILDQTDQRVLAETCR